LKIHDVVIFWFVKNGFGPDFPKIMFEYESKGFLDGLSGETQDADWKRLAKEIGGEFVPGVRDDWGSPSKVVCRVRRWTIILEAFKYSARSDPGSYVMHTRIVADFLTDDYFHFEVSPQGTLDDLKSFFGFDRHDVRIGDENLDGKYVFYGSDAEQTRQLFANENLRRMLAWFDGGIAYGVRGADEMLSRTYRKRSFQLFYDYPGLVYDITKLRVIIELFGETLKQLQAIGSIAADE
jgi:hypothetical protein